MESNVNVFVFTGLTRVKFNHAYMALLCSLKAQWQNLKNLSGGLNLSRGLNMVGST